MHRFYFYVEYDPKQPCSQDTRVEEIERAAKNIGLVPHKEKIKDTVTLQIETEDSKLATMFKLSVETPASSA